MGEFWVPIAEHSDEMDDREFYEAIVEFAKDSEFRVSDRKIERLRHRDTPPGGDERVVGRPYPIEGERVQAILYDESRSLYLVCTENRGVLQGIPYLVGSNEVVSYEEFDP